MSDNLAILAELRTLMDSMGPYDGRGESAYTPDAIIAELRNIIPTMRRNLEVLAVDGANLNRIAYCMRGVERLTLLADGLAEVQRESSR